MKKFPLGGWIVLGLIAAAIIIGGAIIYSNKSNNSNSQNNNTVQQPANNQAAQTPTTQTAVDINKVKTAGEPFTGDANAPVVIAVWEDYQCPFCKSLETNVIPQIVSDYVNTGKVKIVFKDYEFLGADSQTLGKFARAVWEADPSKFYQWRQAMFDNQGQENSGWATQDTIMKITTDAIGSSDAQKALALYNSNGAQYQQLLDADKTEGTSFGINGTPDVIVGDQLIVGAQPYSVFKTAIDQLLSK